ncbi:preprotein translocase subunit SecG [Frigidibacter sp.]|uniref:preprotein translocase subunit SecG n=1 Tax=Frigidibacter sp. TaxID=2586418 RepID=UPI002733BC08|nr:preprotein translocase subunit SecG [Frigidibacter sp.]MDP3342728.1 preprotein translocase subunit SecG [Frigidibacter sp.]
MENVILTVHLILALLLIGVVLLQRSEGGGLGMGGGGGGGSGVMSGRQAANALSKLTWIFAAAFIATSVTLTVLAARDASSGSVVDQFNSSSQGSDAPAVPALPEIELPPPSSDAPAAPPAAD